MNKEKDGLIFLLTKSLKMYQKCQNEIIKEKKKDNIIFQKEFTEGLEYYDKCLKNNNKELTNEDKDKILKIIIMTLSAEMARNIIETSLEVIEIIATNDYLPEEIVSKHLNNLTHNFLCIYQNYKQNLKIIMQLIYLIRTLLGSKTFIFKNESLYNIITLLLVIILQINESENKISIYEIKKTAKLIFNKWIEDLISKSSKINYDFKNAIIYNYYLKFYLNEQLHEHYFNHLMKYYIDNFLDKINKNENHKNEKGIDKGKYNWCFNCRNEANYLSNDLSLPICSKKCENIIKYTEKIMNLKIYYYNNNNESIFIDYINVIKIITSYILYFLNLYLFHFNIKQSIVKEINILDEILKNFMEIVYILLSQPIIKDSDHNEYILELIKEYVFPFLIEISNFNKRANNINGFQNNIKLFELLINDLDDWYIEKLNIEIYTFTENIICPYFTNNNIYNNDFINNSTNHFNYLTIKSYLIDKLSSDLIDFFFELHFNYDNHFYFNNIFINIIKDITNILYDSYDRKFNYESSIDIELTHKIKKNSLTFIFKVIEKIEQFSIELSSKENKEEDEEKNKNINEYITFKNILEEGLEKFWADPSSTINFFIKKNLIPQVKEFIDYKEIYIQNSMYISQNSIDSQEESIRERRYYNNLSYFPVLFKNENETKEKGINKIFINFFTKNFSPNLNYDDFTAYILSSFIRLQFEKILFNNKLIISHFFSSLSSFNLKVLNYYIKNFNFKNYNILEALHLIFHYLPLINKRQVIDKILVIFSNKYIQDNFDIKNDNINFVNEFILKLSQMIVEISYSIIENNNIQNQINNKKLKTINDYINIFKKDFDCFKDIKKLEIMNFSYVYDIYNLTLTYPLNFYNYPNPNSLIDSNGIIKSNNDLFGIFPTELDKMKIINDINDDNIFIVKKNMNKECLINIINSSWEFYLSICSKHIAYYTDSEQINKGIEHILIVLKVSGILKLYAINEIFINSIISMTRLSESLYRKLNSKNVLALNGLIKFIQNNGKYIYSSWYSIFSLLSRINQLKNCNAELLYSLLKIKKFDIDEFTEIYVNNANHAELIDIEPIFTIIKDLSNEILKKFVFDLIKVVEEEINLFSNPKYKKNKERFFSFDKLVYIIDVNREIWKNKENKEIYENINKFFVKLISENPLDDILLNKVKDTFKKIDEYEK